MPLGRAFRLPGPEDPPRMPRIRIQLRLDEFPHVGLVGGGESGDGADVFARARADVRCSGESPVVAGAGAEAVELREVGKFGSGVEGHDLEMGGGGWGSYPFSAIGQTGRPFAHNRPLVGIGQRGA